MGRVKNIKPVLHHLRLLPSPPIVHDDRDYGKSRKPFDAAHYTKRKRGCQALLPLTAIELLISKTSLSFWILCHIQNEKFNYSLRRMQKTPRFLISGLCESKNKEVDPDITKPMIGFSHHIRLDQKRMLSIFCCH